MEGLSSERLDGLLRRLADVSIAVVGDYFLDKYLLIDPALGEPSLETGLEAHQVVGKRICPGAAGTVVSNLHALGVGCIRAVGVTGCDGEGFELRQGLGAWSVDMTGLIEDPDIVTPTYTKPMMRQPDGSEREHNRIDIANREPLSAPLQERVAEQIHACVGAVDGIIVADQVAEPDLGVIGPAMRELVSDIGAQNPDLPLLVDSRGSIGSYRNVIVKPNAREGAAAVGLDYEDETVARDHANAIATELHRRTGRTVYLTLGSAGLAVRDAERFVRIPGHPVEGPVDIVGAGDSTTAGIVSALCAGAEAAEAGLIGALVASITIQQLGVTGTATPEQLRMRFEQYMARHA